MLKRFIESIFKRLKYEILRIRIGRLTRHSDMPRRIELYRAALELVKRDTQPKMWARLQNQLGYSLWLNPLGDRADNLEQAIYHFQQSQEVYTLEATPKKWARSMNNLAEAYRVRIKGERAENLELAIDYLKQSLEVRTRQAASKGWASSMNNLALAYRDRIKGERAENIERAIDYFEQSLEVFTRQAFPQEWANSMNNLANAYLYRIRGEHADNLELAIEHYEQAQKVFTRQNFPFEWAASMNNLAVAYSNRIRGERAENLERTIDYLKQSLEVVTRQDFPEDWARNMGTLATAVENRIRGERAENIELAIDYLKQSLEVATRQDFPFEWAIMMNNFANTYGRRIRGERAENIELAIDYLKQSLEVLTRQAFPEDWARSMGNLARAYLYRIRGERAENIELAISLFEQSLEVYTHQAFPKEWARSINNLANAYLYRIRGERAENLELAIDYLKQSLEVYTHQAFPYEWARSINNLAGAYNNRIKGERADNLERAIDYYGQSREVYTRLAAPYEWATSMSNLAAAYNKRIRGERSENLERAIDYLKQALEVRTPQSFPQDCRDTAYWLGCSLYDEGRLGEARGAFVTAHEAVEALRGEIMREAAKRELAQENADLYARLVSCCLHDANADEEAAFEYAAAGKGRAFVDMLATTRFDLSAVGTDDPELAADWLKYRELRFSIDNLRTRLAGRSTEIDEQLRKQESELLRNLQQQELERWEDLTYKYPALTATQSAPSLSVEEAQALATDLGATLVEFVQHAGGWSAFVVTSEAVRHVSLPDVNDEFLREMVFDWLFKIDQPKFHNQESYWTLDEWYEALIMPLKPHLPPSGKVVLAPAGTLHLIPLTIARHPDTLAYLCDEYTLSFAPSLAALRVTLEEAKKKGAAKDESLGTLLAVAYPGESDQPNYLSHAIAESEAIETHFSNVTRLYDEVATPQAVVEKAKGQAVAHFSCHGTFDSSLPEQSGLALSGGYLTVQRIITELRLSNARLATLSACVTHRADLRAGEEHVGLVQSVLTAGAQSVVASLWSVPEQATRVLFEQFYGAVANGKAPAQALTEAMQHVRQQPGWEHPFYWAAFQVSGLGYELQVST